jgi:hypothetical protein
MSMYGNAITTKKKRKEKKKETEVKDYIRVKH